MEDVQESPAGEGVSEDQAIGADSFDAALDEPQAVSDAPNADSEQDIRMSAVEDTDLLAELASAMHDAAERERERIEAVIADRMTARLDGVRNRAAAQADDLKRTADADLKRIDDWSSTEIARIRVEARRRGDERRAELDADIRDHERRVEAEIAHVAELIAAYRMRLDDFFAELRDTTDPADIAQRAGSLPPMPDLEDLGSASDAGADGMEVAIAEGSAADDGDERGDGGSDGTGSDDVPPVPAAARATPTPPVTAVVSGSEPVADSAGSSRAQPEPQAGLVEVGTAVSATVAEPRLMRGPLRLLRTIAPWSGRDERNTAATSSKLEPADERR